MSSRERNIGIDVIKIIAMIMVVGLHVQFGGGLASSELLKLQYGIGLCAIPLFFMVSGFLMQGKMPDHKYAWRKIYSILKYVFIVIGLTCLLTGLIEGHPRIHSLYLWFIQRGTYWQFWYFGTMIIIYMISPWICKLVASKYAKWGLVFTGICCTIVFFLNHYIEFERTYIIQTFRLWNWLFYFMFGAYIKQYGLPARVPIWMVIFIGLQCTLLVAYGPIRGVEYYHCSIFSMLYAYSVFAFCIGRDWKESWFTKEMSGLFLPVYTIHPFLYQFMSNIQFLPHNASVAYLLRFATILTASILLSFILMKIPYINRIFKI
jgi:surface polysaccharide O-acyltransferase-like enzyme